ncbi:hypothetical protein Q6279_30330, partial [Klebsiella variicola]|nr:hypothetical protein [Klebsiella variicola]
VPVEVATRKGPVTVSEDEQPGKADAAKIPTLKPAFVKDGAVTAASALKAARDHLDPAQLIVVAVGDKAKVQPQLEA